MAGSRRPARGSTAIAAAFASYNLRMHDRRQGVRIAMADPFACTFTAGADLPPCDARIDALYRYWLSIRPPPGRLPGRKLFSPTAIPQLLRLIWLADVQRKPLRFKYRLVGTEHVEAAKLDPTGRWYDEVHPRFAQSSAYPQFVAAAERAEIAFYRGPPVYVMDAKFRTIERLILPMAQDGSEVDMLLGITVLDPKAQSPTPGATSST
jgi:hypothetical protein